ncbi:MAG: AAA-like domain-containing protein [Siphoviridae sp. ctjeG17]|nr:MAG: AAA-like domain-containing protein [Siphoviridae sp. ctjeG17]
MKPLLKIDYLSNVWDVVASRSDDEKNYWASRGLIPLGSKYPPTYYKGRPVPMEDIITIKFDPIHKSFTERSGSNVLLLGDTGDGKSLLMKLAWSVLADAGYWCIYIDSKSTDSGRARLPWSNNRLPPKMQSKGIKLKHYVPYYAMNKMQKRAHNFNMFSLRLSNIYEKEMWMGLGATPVIASKISNYINESKGKSSIRELARLMENLKDDKEIYSQSITGFRSLISNIEDSHVVDEKLKELDMFKDFEDGKSVCISYNKCSFGLMSFDVGEKINRVADSYNEMDRKTPVVFFLDDASLFAKEERSLLNYNFAVEQIKNIGFNYRALGICQWLAVQTLNIIDQDVKDGFQYKIITPKFAHPETLRKINIPEVVVWLLKNNQLRIDKNNHIMEYILVDQDNNVQRFYPFLPPCNHFKEVYFDNPAQTIEEE